MTQPQMYLIDTNVISELRKRNKANSGVQQFFRQAAAQKSRLFISAVTLGELRRGVEIVRHRGDRIQAHLLESWLNSVVVDYADCILDFTEAESQVWGNECDCDWDWEDEFICVATPEGDTIPFPNLCFAECEGYSAEMVVECPEWDGGWNGNECDCDWEEFDPVCVLVEEELVELPNACLALCLGFEEEDIQDCEGLTNDDDDNLDIEPNFSIHINPVEKINLIPNPNVGRMNVRFTAEMDIAQLNINILSLQGQLLQQQTVSASVGQNQVEILATQLPAGIYFVQLASDKFQEMIKFVKQ